MKTLLAVLALIVLGAGSYYVFLVLPDANGRAPDAPPLGAQLPTEKPAQPRPPVVANGPEDELSAEERRQRLWSRLRPASESLLPDPDHIGACPPVDMGASAARVIRRYIMAGNGFKTWVHEDGSLTQLHYGAGGGGTDPKTGKPLPAGEIVTTMVPTKEYPISPDDLQRTGKSPGQGASPASGDKSPSKQ